MLFVFVTSYTCTGPFLCIFLQGCLSSWFRAHPDLLQAVLPIILDGLTNASQASSAALAFRDVCGECAEHLAPVVMQIIPACQVIIHDVYIHWMDVYMHVHIYSSSASHSEAWYM